MWTTVRAIPNDYNDEAKRIDEKILGLVKQRRILAGGQRFFPDQETVEKWAAQFEMAKDQVNSLLHNLNDVLPMRQIRDDPGRLLGVLPIMKRTVSEDCEFILSHAMQHENASIVTLEVKYQKENAGNIHLRPALQLIILGGEEYIIRRTSGRGGGERFEMRFRVEPALPDDLTALEFSLIPGNEEFINIQALEIKLDKQVDFY
ncbi:hypothetical protein PAECIP111892_04065 [Paenibacillus auburnensis]|uniref:Uncharacterized protein n=1 Tax=Paenibacillus auburnensis TaxID=2905649 RepID=A0ABN8GSR7_9BACL|nr:hypothetical protein [Paenibacillus auburnensis]CAH1214708.1 hypothetical protein PAECIP111892_04065 [Paenibacillus auburnensis]